MKRPPQNTEGVFILVRPNGFEPSAPSVGVSKIFHNILQSTLYCAFSFILFPYIVYRFYNIYPF